MFLIQHHTGIKDRSYESHFFQQRFLGQIMGSIKYTILKLIKQITLCPINSHVRILAPHEVVTYLLLFEEAMV